MFMVLFLKKKGCFYLVRFHAGSLRKSLVRRGGTHRVLSLGAHQPGLQHVQGLAQEGGTATLRGNSTVTSRHVKGRAAAGGRERPITYGDEAGQEVCEYVVAHDSRSQDQLLGLVVAGQLKGRGNNKEGQGHLNGDQEED